jgi:hypothetical protein
MGLPPIFKFTHTGTGRHELAELVRYGKPLVLDMKEVDLFDQLPDLFDQIRPGLWKVTPSCPPCCRTCGPSWCPDSEYL